jgi:hypothetical protein
MSMAWPSRTMWRSVQQQKLAVPVSRLIAPGVSGLRTNVPRFSWIATRCFAATGPPAATAANVAPAAARARTAVSFLVIARLLASYDTIRGKRVPGG